MGKAQARGLAQPGHYRAALALVDREPYQVGICALGQLLNHRRAGRAGRVVDQHAGQIGGAQGVHHYRQGVFVVVHRDHGARLMHLSPPRRMG
ncbi:hypothetical protein D9M68_833620 [compost metagenome]